MKNIKIAFTILVFAYLSIGNRVFAQSTRENTPLPTQEALQPAHIAGSDSPEKMEKTCTQNPPRARIGCKPLTWSQGRIEIIGDKGPLKISMQKNKKELQHLNLEVSGPEAQCIDLIGFESKNIFFIKYYKGEAGTSELVRKTVQVAMRLKDQKLTIIKEVNLITSILDGDSSEIETCNASIIRELKDALEWEIVDNLSINDPKQKKSSVVYRLESSSALSTSGRPSP